MDEEPRAFCSAVLDPRHHRGIHTLYVTSIL